MKIIDAFIFYNEVNLLKLRLFYLADIVDHFVICESDTTFSGASKPYYLDEVILTLPKNIVSKIIRIKLKDEDLLKNTLNYINIPEMPEYNINIEWKRERLQREALTSIAYNFPADDFFILSDVDEIPKIEIIQMWAKIISHLKDTKFVYVLEHTNFQYNFFTTYSYIVGSVFSNMRTVREKGCDLLRSQRVFNTHLKDAGWHFSYFGNVDFIKNKINSFAHQELNILENTQIAAAVQQQQDLFSDTKYLEYEFEKFPDKLQNIIKTIFPSEFYVKSVSNPSVVGVTNITPEIETLLLSRIFSLHTES